MTAEAGFVDIRPFTQNTMPPSTRSRTSTPATAPVSRTYRSSRPPQQVQFPGRTKKIKTYGRSSSARAARRQQTLTQLNYVVPQDLEDTEVLADDSPEQPQKRRRTLGDSPSSSFHTQTLTQLLSVKGEDADDGEDLLRIKDSDDEDEEDLLWVKDSDDEYDQIKRTLKIQNSDDEGDMEAATVRPINKREAKLKGESRELSMVPQTPTGKRIKTEIPSSQPTPFTPMLERYTPPGKERSPLKERSTNVGAALPSEEMLAKTPRNLVIQDSFCTVPSTTHSEDTQEPHHRSPLRELRPSQVRARLSLELGHSDALDKRNTSDEIPDSDDDFGSLGPTPQKDTETDESEMVPDPGTPTPRPRKRQTPTSNKTDPGTPVPVVVNQTTPAHDEADESTEDECPGSPSPLPKKQRPLRLRSSQIGQDAHRASSPETSPLPVLPPRQSPAKTQYQTQALESQRIPLTAIQSMGPVADKSDIIISIHPEHVENIANGTKNHEFRKYKIPPSARRFWIYTTRPLCQLRYMAQVGPVKIPGQIDSNSGLGNAEFNEGQTTDYAYELEQVYELNNPVSLQVMKQNGWMGAPPQTFCYVPPAVVGQLLGNLKCALFEENPLQSSLNMSISQEVEAQIKSDIAQSTQHPTSEAEIVPSSQVPEEYLPPTTSKDDDKFARPSVPARRLLSSQRAPASSARADHNSNHNNYSAVRPSQATTASQPSSQVPSPEKSSVPRPPLLSSGPAFPEDIDDASPLQDIAEHLSMDSSQLVLPDSLYEDVKKPPIVLDSEDEDEDDE